LIKKILSYKIIFQHSHHHFHQQWTRACMLKNLRQQRWPTLSQWVWQHHYYRTVLPVLYHLSSTWTDGSQKAPNLGHTEGVVGQSSHNWQCFTVFKLVWVLALLCCTIKVVIFSDLTLEVWAFISVRSQWMVCWCSRKSRMSPLSRPKRQCTSLYLLWAASCTFSCTTSPMPVLGIGEASPWVLCSIVGTSVQEGHGGTGAGPEKGNKASEGLGKSALWGEAEGAGAV